MNNSIESEPNEVIVTYGDFLNFNLYENSTNNVNCDGPLYQFMECQGECYCNDIYKNKFNEIIATAIKYGKIEILRSMDIPKCYFDYACRFNNIEIIELFISRYNDLNMDLALEIACVYNYPDLAMIALLNGADVHKFDDKALIIAIMNNSSDIVKILINHGTDIHTFNDMSFVLACENGNITIVNLLIENGVDIHTSGEYEYEENEEKKDEENENETGIYKDEGFRLACRNGHIEVIEILLRMGVDVNIGFNYACKNGDIDLVKSLIGKGADISRALQYASTSDNLNLVLYLISIGCEIDLENGNDLKGARNKDIINFLLDNGSSPVAETIGNLLYFNDYNVAELLLNGYKRKETFDDQMRCLISNGKYRALELLFKYVNLDCTNALEYCLAISRSYGCGSTCIKILENQCFRFKSC